jgi:hypothetical protein
MGRGNVKLHQARAADVPGGVGLKQVLNVVLDHLAQGRAIRGFQRRVPQHQAPDLYAHRSHGRTA